MIPEELKKLIDYVIDYVGASTNDWFIIKKELVNLFPPKERSRFSRRHYSTKKHILNEFDYLVIGYWEKKVGTKLIVDEKKLHPKNWAPKMRGWGLKEFNEKRQGKTEITKIN